MRPSQSITVQMSELREKINGLPAEAEASEIDALTKTYTGMEARYRAAVIVEAGEDERAASEDGPDDEAKEKAAIKAKASLSDYILEALNGVTLTGAAAELRAAELGAEGVSDMVPLVMFDDTAAAEMEQRADATTNIATAIPRNQQSIAARVFARGAAAYMGVQTPTVPVGTTSYPRLNAGTTADARNAGVELDGVAATLSTQEINPVRLTASYTFSTESLQRVRGFEEALRADIMATIADKRDFLALNGQAAVANASPVVAGLLSALVDPDNPTALATWSDYLNAFDASVDGKYAQDDTEVRILTNLETWRQARGLSIGDQAQGGLLRDRLPGARFRPSANMPNTGANKFAAAIAYASGSPARGFFMPTWAGVTLIVDPYTKAKGGEKILTAVAHVGFAMVDANAYKQLVFQVQA